MTSVIAALKRAFLGRRRRVPVRECRECGTTVEPGTEECPACSATTIVSYDVSR